MNHQAGTDFSAADARFAMGVDWTMTGDEISQAVPPAFSRRFVAESWIRNSRFGESAGRDDDPASVEHGADSQS
jgi:hypothetical protein